MSVFDWIVAHSGDVIVLSGIALVVAAVIMGMLRDKKKGKSCCGGCSGCSGCSGAAGCSSCSACAKK